MPVPLFSLLVRRMHLMGHLSLTFVSRQLCGLSVSLSETAPASRIKVGRTTLSLSPDTRWRAERAKPR